MSNKINKFKEDMNKWIEYGKSIETMETELRSREKKIKEIKKHHQNIEFSIIRFKEEHNLKTKKFNIKDMSIHYHLDSKKEPLTHKFIKESLESYFLNNFNKKLDPSECENKANEIFQYMLNLRKEKNKSSLKKIVLK